MKFLASFFFWSIISTTCLGQAYICNLDYHEDIRQHQVGMGATAIFLPEDCALGKKTTYQETIGEFIIQIICEDQIFIHVTQKQKTISDIIEQENFRKRFLKSYVSGRSGLRISCQERSIGLTLVENT